MTCFKSALIPDFAEHYHLRFMEVVGTYPAGETLALIEGLPPTSRLAGRLVGERHRTGWDERDFMQLDMRNSLEVLKAITLAKGSKTKRPNQPSGKRGLATKRRSIALRRKRLRVGETISKSKAAEHAVKEIVTWLIWGLRLVARMCASLRIRKVRR